MTSAWKTIAPVNPNVCREIIVPGMLQKLMFDLSPYCQNLS
jgi:hypothetical protein